MRVTISAVALMAVVGGAAAAQDQVSAWQFIRNDPQGPLAAAVAAKNGNQFIFKCDKPGKRSVYAVFYSEETLGRPGPVPSSRSVTYRFDNGPPVRSDWRYYEHTAVALNLSRIPALSKLLGKMGDGKSMELRVEPLNGPPITSTFDITGAKDAIAQVFESCKDKMPR